MSKRRGTVEWGLLWIPLPGLALLVAGGYQSFETQSFLNSSAPATAVVTAMQDTSTSEGYHLCYATVEVPVGSTTAHAKISLGGYWPETDRSCAKVGDHLAIRRSLTDPSDVRPSEAIWMDAQQSIGLGLFFSLPLFIFCGIAFVGWWLRRPSRTRPRPTI